MAKPNKKQPTRTVDVYCAKCKQPLYKYRKGGKGALVKCFQERIVVDYTSKLGECPQCQATFARETMIRGLPANKIIGGKVTFK
ncbi:hypothetical protein AB6E04_08445 [Vibrio amylolyticus]|uniref:hypothetical protein n=1 Tax=Vibrio amylolyticus TaxID=2847292 RepID=UPI00354F58C9